MKELFFFLVFVAMLFAIGLADVLQTRWHGWRSKLQSAQIGTNRNS
jgi:hypothetical protein